MPEHYGPLSPILHVVPLQLLAYHTACARGTDVDTLFRRVEGRPMLIVGAGAVAER